MPSRTARPRIKANSAGPPAKLIDPLAPLTREEFNQLLTKLDDIRKRGIRTETRVSRLLEHHGLDLRGQPVRNQETRT